MNVKPQQWRRLRMLPFIEQRYVEAMYSTAPDVAFMSWNEYRFCNPFHA